MLAERWSASHVATAALGLVLAATLPLVGVVYYRLHQSRSHAPIWAELARASRWLSTSAVCDGGASAEMARQDLQRWSEALVRLTADRAGWAADGALAAQLAGMALEIERTRRAASGEQLLWTQGNCGSVRRLGERSLDRAIAKGLDPSSRGDRYEDLALRDVTVLSALWLLAFGLTLRWARGAIVRPVRRLRQVMQRVADGDLSAEIPLVAEGEMVQLGRALRRAIHGFERRDRAKSDKLWEMRELVRHAVDACEQPLLVLGREREVEYANRAAAALLGRPAEDLVELRLTGASDTRALMQTIEAAFAEAPRAGELASEAEPALRHVVVHDARGHAARLIITLEAAEKATWRRLLGLAASDREATS